MNNKITNRNKFILKKTLITSNTRSFKIKIKERGNQTKKNLLRTIFKTKNNLIIELITFDHLK